MFRVNYLKGQCSRKAFCTFIHWNVVYFRQGKKMDFMFQHDTIQLLMSVLIDTISLNAGGTQIKSWQVVCNDYCVSHVT